MITVSIVSHGHRTMVARLLSDLVAIQQVTHVILTLNLPEPLPEIPDALLSKLVVIENTEPKGYGANQNQAFKQCNTAYFCVLNPDIRLPQNPFLHLLESIQQSHVAMVAPAIVNSAMMVEDSVRFFPTLPSLLIKLITGRRDVYHFSIGDSAFFPDWVAGMFMLFDAQHYTTLKGFDERFFLYYEDVDICLRIWKVGLRVLVCPQEQAIHDAQRSSHRQFRFLYWHVTSMLRYFFLYGLRLPHPDRATGSL